MSSATDGRPQRYAGGPSATARRYTVTKAALRDIRKRCAVYGSQARVLQVATELLIRQKKPIKLTYSVKQGSKTVTMSYKLLPRTIQLIDNLTPIYGSHGQVFDACVQVLGKDPAGQ